MEDTKLIAIVQDVIRLQNTVEDLIQTLYPNYRNNETIH
jgi:hypothetical protein